MFFKKKNKQKNMKSKIKAGIYIDSQALFLKIVQREDNKIKFIEELEYPVNLGSDTFANYKIGFDNVDKMLKGLSGFIKTIETYNINKDSIIIVATTAIRAAENKDYILDQIHVKTGLKVEVLTDNAEKFIIYRGIRNKLSEISNIDLEKKSLLSYIGTGRLGIGIYENEMITSTQNIRVGSLKLSEILGEIQEKTDKFYLVVEEYLSSFSYMLKSFLNKNSIKTFIATGKNLNLILRLLEAKNINGLSYISKNKFNNFYAKIKDKTPNQISQIYNLSLENSEILLPSMAIYKNLWSFTNSKKMIILDINLIDVLLYEEVFPKKSKLEFQNLKASTIISAKKVGEKYDYNYAHATVIEKFALKIFDNLREIHGLDDRDRLLLQLAAILHDIGKFISLKNHYDHSYELIRSSHIFGVTNKELEIIANISKYHSVKIPDVNDENYKKLDNENKILVSKLAALLRLADSLDRAHKNKIKDIEIKLKKDSLNIIAVTDEPIFLEKWVFNEKTNIFEQIFGIKANLMRKETR
ncbi:MAG: HD domain-containing protein [Fusobacteriota bacterium]